MACRGCPPPSPPRKPLAWDSLSNFIFLYSNLSLSNLTTFSKHRANKWQSSFGHKDKPRNGSTFVGHVTWQKLWTDSFLVQEFSHKIYFPYQLAQPDKFLEQAKVLYELLFNCLYDIRVGGGLIYARLLLIGLFFFWINHCFPWLNRGNWVWLNTCHPIPSA